MGTVSLDTLPHDPFLDVISHLDAARDISALSAVSRRTRQLTRHNGWRSFTTRGFPSLDIPFNERTDWNALAERATYLDQCWEKRAFVPTHFFEANKPRGGGRGGRRKSFGRNQTVSFHPVLDARLVSSLEDEFVAWGAGEDIITRRNPFNRPGKESWSRHKGSELGYRGGMGDVTAISIVNRGDAPEILAGRANGHLKLTSIGEHEANDATQTLHLEPETTTNGHSNGTSTPKKSPGQTAITWTEWQPEANIVASCKHTRLTLHDLNDTGATELNPILTYDFAHDKRANEICLARSAKFLNKDTIICALGGSHRPLRWGKITPTGIDFVDAATSFDGFERLAVQMEIETGEKTTVRAIDPVGRGRSESLLLSAWDDGTFRLQDIRTPAPYDALYRDRWSTYEAASSLLVYGTQRFVAGDNTGAKLRFYDFRYPKSYHYTDTLPCDTESPYPPQSFSQTVALPGETIKAHCDAPGGKAGRCTYHERSRWDAWRLDATLYLNDGDSARVYALAKASDLSDTFYAGLHGSIQEISLRLAEDVKSHHTKSRSPPPGWVAAPPRGRVSLTETGVSLCKEGDAGPEQHGVPMLRIQHRTKPHVPEIKMRSRLDTVYVTPKDTRSPRPT